MRPTSWRLLLATGVVGSAIGFLGARFWDLWTGSPPAVPWARSSCCSFLLLASPWPLDAASPHPASGGHPPLDPFTAARTAVLALAGSRAVAAVAGVYLGYAGFLLIDLANDYRRRMVVIALAAALAGIALALAALWLEHICRIKDDEDEPGGPSSVAA